MMKKLCLAKGEGFFFYVTCLDSMIYCTNNANFPKKQL
jgi:hypothetical protein